MERKMLDVTVTGLLVLGAAQLAQGACVDPVGFPRNDVDLDGLAFQIASAAPLPVGLEVDMNGIQRGNDQRLWATHGTFVGFVDVAGGEAQWVASWTKNTLRETEEWVCRLRLEPGTTTLFGEGAVHTVTPGAAAPLSTRFIEQCRMDLVADCP
ncbi:MAG: hypothetical protein H6983_13905 [Ectothiorhodospiraceae bacterium]|nr:hypothetical protein [Ectothiorhodospiraceae bacterium]